MRLHDGIHSYPYGLTTAENKKQTNNKKVIIVLCLHHTFKKTHNPRNISNRMMLNLFIFFLGKAGPLFFDPGATTL
jgi:hypothetical protein